MSESFSDVTPEIAFDLELEDTLPQTNEGDSLNNLRDLRSSAVPVRSLTNSPGCSPRSSASNTPSGTDINLIHPIHAIRPVRRARTVRTDAWAVPASANWTRTRTTIRKVSRVSRSTDWALPF